MGRMLKSDLELFKRKLIDFHCSFHPSNAALNAIVEHIDAIELELKISKEDEQEAVREVANAFQNIDRLTDNIAHLQRENKRLMVEVDEAREEFEKQGQTLFAVRNQNEALKKELAKGEPKKVVLPKREADAIEWARGTDRSNERIIRRFVDRSQYAGENTGALRAIPFNKLIVALVNGYTVEQTKEERLREGMHKIISEWWEDDRSTDLTELLTDFVTKFNAEN